MLVDWLHVINNGVTRCTKLHNTKEVVMELNNDHGCYVW